MIKMKLFLFFVIFGVTVSLAVAQSNCGGNCPGGNCPTCPCGTASRVEDIATWCAKYTWGQTCCKCIVQAESRGNANAVGYNSGSNPSYDVGLWQINDFNWGSGGCGAGAPCDPTANLNCAIQVYKWGGNTWKNWATASGCGCANSP